MRGGHSNRSSRVRPRAGARVRRVRLCAPTGVRSAGVGACVGVCVRAACARYARVRVPLSSRMEVCWSATTPPHYRTGEAWQQLTQGGWICSATVQGWWRRLVVTEQRPSSLEGNGRRLRKPDRARAWLDRYTPTGLSCDRTRSREDAICIVSLSVHIRQTGIATKIVSVFSRTCTRGLTGIER